MFRPKYRLVLVDDEAEILEVLSLDIQRLFPDRFEVMTFTDPRSALEYCAEEGCNAVFSDLRMPEMSGATLCDHLHRLQSGIQTIILTGFAQVVDIFDHHARNGFSYLMKPYETEDLKEVLTLLLNNHERWARTLRRYASERTGT